MKYIDRLQTIKLYYSFLNNNLNGKFDYLSNHINKIITYLLFVDQIVLPPSFFLEKSIAFENLYTLANNEIIAMLVEFGKIITTTSDLSVTDFKDLKEKYTHTTFLDYDIPMKIYARNESKQKQEYSKFILNRIKNDPTINNDEKIEIEKFLKTNPKREEFDSYVKNYFSYATIQKVISFSSKAYFYGGAVGNDAIIPSINKNDTESFYNPFYSLEFIENFMKKMNFKLYRLNADKLRIAIDGFSYFRQSFFSFAQKFKIFYEKVFAYLSRLNNLGFNIWKFARYALYLIIEYVASYLSSLFISNLFVTNQMLFHSVSFAVSATLEIVSLHKLVIDKFYLLLQKLRIYEPYKRELDIILDEFNTNTQKIKV